MFLPRPLPSSRRSGRSSPMGPPRSHPVLRALGGLGLAATLLGAAPRGSRACPPQLDAASLPPTQNGIEAGLGTTNSNAAVGEGGLTATLSRCGEITSLKWPGPSTYDQLHYVTSNAPDARALPHFGALDDMGAFAGLAWKGAGGSGFSWLRDADWRVSQRYTRSTSDVVRTEWVNDALGLHVVGDAFVLPGRDVLALHFEVRRDPGSPVRHARLIFYENLAPTRTLLPEFPIGDTGLDFRNDHALVYDADEHALLHYIPGEQGPGLADLFAPPRIDTGPLEPILRAPPADPAALRAAVQAAITQLTQPGVYIAIGARGGDDGFQAGFDDAPFCEHQSDIAERALASLGLGPEATGIARFAFVCRLVVPDPGGPLARCRAQNGWTWQAENAYADAEDGELSGSPLAACHANGALAKDLVFPYARGAAASATFYLAAARTRDEAYALLREARAPETSAIAQRAATEREWAAWLAPARLPATRDPEVLRFARRALLSLRTATDAASGAIVASVAAQPPYGLDWPRDGSFFDRALDVAGYHERASAHQRFTVRVQRTSWAAWSIAFPFTCNPAAPSYPSCVPPGTWAMNYYALRDSAVAGGPISFEIDETGLPIWAFWLHAQQIADPAERAAHLALVCPAIARGAETLATCHHPDDPDPRLQCLAPEDDNQALTQGLQGAETTLLGLRTAVAAADACGFDPAQVDAWRARSEELQAGLLDRFLVDTPAPDFDGPRFEGSRSSWALWPAQVLPPEDPRMRSHAEFLRVRDVEPVLARTAERLGYQGEALDARAQFARAVGDAGLLAEVRDEVRFFVREGTTPGTGHKAEFAVRVPIDLDGDGIAPDYLPENDVPHAWQQAILYLAAMEAFGARTVAPARMCDASGDGVVDRADIDAIRAARGRPSRGLLDPFDLDEDGRITEADARGCVARCDHASCGRVVHACGLLGPELLVPLAWVGWRRGRRSRDAGGGRASPGFGKRENT
jgi:hypothetical protein